MTRRVDMGARIPVAIADGHLMHAQAVACALRSFGFDCHVLDVGVSVAEQVASCPAEIVLLELDLCTGPTEGIDLVEPLVALGKTPIVVCGTTDRLRYAEALLRGAAGVVPKSEGFAALVEALNAVGRGDTVIPDGAERMRMISELLAHRQEVAACQEPFAQLTVRESEVLAALMAGTTPSEMCASQYVSISTVRSHVKSMLRKLGVSSQLKAVALAHRAGWNPPAAQDASAKGSAG